MKKKIKLISFLALSVVMGYSFQGYTDCGLMDPEAPMTPWTTVDYGRSITGIIAGIMEQTGDGEIKAQIIATQEGTNKNANGSGGGGGGSGSDSGSEDDSDSSKNTENQDEQVDQENMGKAGSSEFTTASYGYVEKQLFNKDQVVRYVPLATALSSGNTRQAVIDTFYADPSKENQKTTEYQTKILNQRKAYAKEAAERHVTLAYRILWGSNKKGGISGDLSSISQAALTGDGEIGTIAVDGYTLDQAIRMELLDLSIQIELMEADAIQFMLHQPVELMSETKPATTEA